MGPLHKKYLEEHHPIRYNQLLLSGELSGYLAKLDKQAEEQLVLTVRQMQKAEDVTEDLKAADQLEWGAPDEQHPKPRRGNHQV